MIKGYHCSPALFTSAGFKRPQRHLRLRWSLGSSVAFDNRVMFFSQGMTLCIRIKSYCDCLRRFSHSIALQNLDPLGSKIFNELFVRGTVSDQAGDVRHLGEEKGGLLP